MPAAIKTSQRNRKLPSHKEDVTLRAAIRISRLAERYPEMMLNALLKTPFLPSELTVGVQYQRHDENGDGGAITVGLKHDGSAWIRATDDPQDRTVAHQFTSNGSPQVYKAIAILAAAMMVDNFELPRSR